ncbi:hypothetical protein JD969_19520 [Planctomycetota bacterium]|nr:hypothetical protein JD969_19520 [Planctomycetota bacterium]
MHWIYFNVFLTLITLSFLLLSLRGKRTEQQANRKRSKIKITISATLFAFTLLITTTLSVAQINNINLNPYKPLWLLNLELKHYSLSSSPEAVWQELYNRNKTKPFTTSQGNATASAILTYLQAHPNYNYSDIDNDENTLFGEIIESNQLSPENFARMEKLMLANLTSSTPNTADFAAIWLSMHGYNQLTLQQEKAMLTQQKTNASQSSNTFNQLYPIQRISPETERKSLQIAFDLLQHKYPKAAITNDFITSLIMGPLDHDNYVQDFGQKVAQYVYTYQLTTNNTIDQDSPIFLKITTKPISDLFITQAKLQLQTNSLTLHSKDGSIKIPLAHPTEISQ